MNLPALRSDIGQICPAVLVFALTPYCSPTVSVAPRLITPEVKSLTGWLAPGAELAKMPSPSEPDWIPFPPAVALYHLPSLPR